MSSAPFDIAEAIEIWPAKNVCEFIPGSMTGCIKPQVFIKNTRVTTAASP